MKKFFRKPPKAHQQITPLPLPDDPLPTPSSLRDPHHIHQHHHQGSPPSSYASPIPQTAQRKQMHPPITQEPQARSYSPHQYGRSSSQDQATEDQWVILNSSNKDSLPYPQPPSDSRTSSLASLPPGASAPAQYAPPSVAHSAAPPASLATPQPKRKSPVIAMFNTPGARSTNGHGNGASVASVETPYAESTYSVDPKDRDKHHWNLGIFSAAKDREQREREKDRDRERETLVHPSRDPEWTLTQVMGYWIGNKSEDWMLVLDICDRAGSSEAGAKEAARALRKEFKYGPPQSQLVAARLWAIMIRKCEEPFLKEINRSKFLDGLDEVLSSPNTQPVVRERLLDVLAGAAFQFRDRDDGRHGYISLWRRVRPDGKPEIGIPFDPTDPMFSPNISTSPLPTIVQPGPTPQRPSPKSRGHSNLAPPINNASRPPRDQRDTRDRDRDRDRDPQRDRRRDQPQDRDWVIPAEEDMRKLFEECEMARGNSQLLINSLTYAKPDDLHVNGGVIEEFHTKCLRSQDMVVAQIPWATAQADKSRTAALLAYTSDTESHTPPPVTAEENLLAALLAANEELQEAFRIYNELERLGRAEKEEREVQERSLHETRLDRTKIEYVAPDGSFLTTGDGPSRSPSPAQSATNNTAATTALPVTPSSIFASLTSPPPPPPLPTPPVAPQPHHARELSNAHHALAPPPHAPQGPRLPIGRSRTPSPDSILKSMQEKRSKGMDAVRRGMARIDLGGNRADRDKDKDKDSDESHSVSRSHVVESKSGHSVVSTSATSVPTQDDEEDEVPRTPIRPSAKALGKRRAPDPPERGPDTFDPDDMFKTEQARTPMSMEDEMLELDDPNRPKPKPIHYVYDAAAEREKERQRAMLAAEQAQGPKAALINGLVH
ncbi:hypothetical protein BOTBODRAFT_53695 [Botryobasidium botryosum FD-172 SS1]|uniref:VHS domain-containing protein n=1 Tax=Botryobasidium botryosum (strain FD-172 SS1) TaxID=930990 RepID=A0A067MNH5_BOTB1|nr:hypothetical protein BOTBODRAFT_53695 [Botryobasidium botryosum FD-172 SS1]